MYISAKWSDLNITTTTSTATTTQFSMERGGRRKSHSWQGKERKSNSQRCCLHCWYNKVIAIMSHHVHTQKNRTTKLLISSSVHYVHLGRDNKTQNVCLASNISFCIFHYFLRLYHFCRGWPDVVFPVPEMIRPVARFPKSKTHANIQRPLSSHSLITNQSTTVLPKICLLYTSDAADE